MSGHVPVAATGASVTHSEISLEFRYPLIMCFNSPVCNTIQNTLKFVYKAFPTDHRLPEARGRRERECEVRILPVSLHRRTTYLNMNLNRSACRIKSSSVDRLIESMHTAHVPYFQD